MARKNVADAAKAKAEKQKKMVIVLGGVLALAMAYAVHTMMGMNKSSAGSKPVAADTTAASTTPSTVTPAATPPSAPTLGGTPPATTGTPAAAAGASATSPISSQLIASVKPPADAGQLDSFSLFESKDPFRGGGPTVSGGTSGGGGSSKPPKTPPAPPTPAPLSAVISVNGASESVSAGSSFPSADPMFQLVSLTGSTARVAVAGGSYANGAATLTLKVGKPVTLVNTADGTRYTLTLQPQGTVAPAPSSSSGTTTPTTTTTSP